MDLNNRSDYVDVLADINYFPATGEVDENSEDWKPRHLNDSHKYTRKMAIHDIRGIEDQFDIDMNGFMFTKIKEKPANIETEENVVRHYYPQIAKVIQNLVGASAVYVWNHCVRKCSDPSLEGMPTSQGRYEVTPSGHPHVDYAGQPADFRGCLEFLKSPEYIIKRFDTSARFAFVNAWRPLKTVKRDPLAVADAITVPDADYRVRQSWRPPVTLGSYAVAHGSEEDQHSWYYVREMEPDELLVFKGYDTRKDAPGWRCPHTAFVLPGTSSLAPRESIEVRAVCFWD